MKNTEANLIITIVTALMGRNLNFQYEAYGTYSSRDRRIELDFGQDDVGPIIGSKGSMKLAIQTLLACPFGGDSTQIFIRTNEPRRTDIEMTPGQAEDRLVAVLTSMRDHYPPGKFHFRIERSPSTLVVLIDSPELFVESMRGALSKLIRSIGRRHGIIAVVSIES